MKKRIYCLLTSAILLGSISTPCFANTLSNTTNKTSSNIMQIINTESQLIEFLRANDVDNSTQKKLIEKFNKGEKWDSWKSSEGYTEKIKLKDGSIKDRKSTRLNSSHANISYAVFCLKKKKK